jgi:hypothetical protein
MPKTVDPSDGESIAPIEAPRAGTAAAPKQNATRSPRANLRIFTLRK